MKHFLFALLILLSVSIAAQPDTLWVPSHGTLIAHAVNYQPVEQVPQYTRVGRFSSDTSRVAVELGYKRGIPSGIYRAYYPDGRPLIFAIYGWGSLHGDWTEYGEDGTITLKGQYRQGKRDGPWAFKKEGIFGHYKHGEKHGIWKYFENGRVSYTEKYRHDKLVRTRTF